MFITLLVQPRMASVAVWGDLSISLFVRACIWLFGLLFLPGLYLVRISGISQRLSRISQVAIAVNLSFVFVSLVSLIFYFAKLDYLLLPYILLALTVILGCIYWLKSKEIFETQLSGITRWYVLLLITLLCVIVIAFFVQANMRYLIPGDNWVSLKPAVSLISQRKIYEFSPNVQYPPIFGFTLSGLAVCCGFPIVNTYVLLFPLVGLNILSFFALLKTVFEVNDKVNVLACMLYGFGGGFGWLIQVLTGGSQSFWTASLLSQDMYFSVFFWSSIQFSYKSLAITLVFAALTVFAICAKTENQKIKLAAIGASALLLWFSFLTHMLDAVIIAPVIFGISYLYQKGLRRFINIGVLLAITTAIAFIVDFLIEGYYFSLIAIKTELLFSTLNLTNILLYSTLIAGVLFTVILFRRKITESNSSVHAVLTIELKSVKSILIYLILGFYIAGLFVWSASSSNISAGFPWYRYVTRYGIIGGLAIISLKSFSWRNRWFLLTSLWSIISIVVGSIWWGERTNSYLFPMLTLLAAVALSDFWVKSQNRELPCTAAKGHSFKRTFYFKLRKLKAPFLIALIALSSTSVIYGAYHYVLEEQGASDDAIRVFLWVSQNTPANSTIVVPESYTISKGIYTISDRKVIKSSDLPNKIDAASFTNLTQIIENNNIHYAVTSDDVIEINSLFTNLLVPSNCVFQSGKIKVFEIP